MNQYHIRGQRYHIVGSNDDAEFFMTKDGWVSEFKNRGLYSFSGAMAEVKAIHARNLTLDTKEIIRPSIMTEQTYMEKSK